MWVPAEGTIRRVTTFVAAFGIGVALYIAISEADGGSPTCIAGGGGCQAVADSPYSELLGINVAVLGVLGYVLLLATSFLRGDLARLAGFGLALSGFGFSLYLTYLELFVIEAICQWCVVSAILMTILFAANTVRMLRYVGEEP